MTWSRQWPLQLAAKRFDASPPPTRSVSTKSRQIGVEADLSLGNAHPIPPPPPRFEAMDLKHVRG